MNVKEPVQDGCIVRVGIELSSDEIQPKIDEAFESTRKSASLPGFRPGKVPTSVLKQRFGKQVREEATDEIIKEKLPDALQEIKINPIALAPVEDLVYADDGGINFTAVLEIAPEVDASKWKGASVERLIVNVTDEDVERHIDTLRRDKAVVTEAGADDETSLHDRLTVDMQEVDDSGLAIVGNKNEATVFELGTGYLGADSDEKLLGMKIDETRRVQIDEEKSEIVDLPGKGVSNWDVLLKSFEKVDLPEVDDDFAAQIDEKFKNVDEFKQNVRDQLTAFSQFQANQHSAAGLREAVIGAYDFDLPPSLLGKTLSDMAQRQMQEMGNSVDPEQLHQYLTPIAHQELSWFFIRRSIMDAENIEATDEDIEEHVENYHKAHSEMDLEELKVMFKSGEKREQLSDEIIMGKIMEVLRNGVKWEDKTVSFMEVLQGAQSQHAPTGGE